MEGLPQNPDALGLAMILLGLVAAAVYGLRVRRAQSIAVAAVAVLAIAAFPYIAWRVTEDIRYTSRLDPWIANRYGVSVFRVHPAIFDNAASHMPADARYYLASSPRIDDTRRKAFAQWAAGWLLPRIAVASPAQADYVLTLGLRPDSVGAPIARTWRVMPPVQGTPAAYLGRVRR